MNLLSKSIKKTSAVFVCVISVLLLTGVALLAAVGDGGPTGFVPDHLIVNFKTTPTSTDISEIAALAGAAECRPMPVSRWYVLDAKGSGRTMEQMRTALESEPRIAQMHPNQYFKKLAVPNDRYWNLQWNMRAIRMPEAWEYAKGSKDVTVAVIDDGVWAEHPDFAGRVLPGYDVSELDTDANPDGGQHGTHVAGTIAAQGNNGIGVVGVCWDNVRILPLKIFPESTTENVTIALDIALNGKYDITPTVDRADVVNMSIGTYVNPGAVLGAKLQQLQAAGIIVCAATGNDFGPILWPAAYDSVIAVGSVGPYGVATNYSNFGPEIDIVAPGGQAGSPALLDVGGIVSTVPPDLWESFQGTSMACPHVAGAAALLLSAGVPAASVRPALLQSAKPAGGAVPNRQYGWGILDVAKAIQYPSNTVSIESPRHGDSVATYAPFFHIRAPGAAPTSIDVLLDGSAIIFSGQPVSGAVSNFEYNEATGDLVFVITFAEQGSHTLSVTAASALSLSSTATDQASFTIAPRHLNAGRYMIAFPYASNSDDPFELLHTGLYRMARAVNEVSTTGVSQFRYAFFNFAGMPSDDEGTLMPPSVFAREVGGDDQTLPRGLGYWLDVRFSADVIANRATDPRYAYEIDLTTGWNQIGNPYPHPIAWNSAVVTYLGRTVGVSEAASRGWISASLHRYENGGYQSFTAPNGVLEPWEAYWIKVKVPGSLPLSSSVDPKGIVTLTFSPARVTTETDTRLSVASIQSASSAASSMSAQALGSQRGRRGAAHGRFLPSSEWKVQFEVGRGGTAGNGPTIGVASGASDGYDLSDIESPPPGSDRPWAACAENGWGSDSGYFATDIKSDSGGTKTWYVDVFSYNAGPVTLGWRSLLGPARIDNLRITDLGSGKALSTLRASYQFDAPAGASVRRFKVTVAGRAR